MIGGQKVIKVFCHEEEAKAELSEEESEAWQRNSAKANGYANAHDAYDECTGVLPVCDRGHSGGIYGHQQCDESEAHRMDTMTLGMIASFLTLSRSFTGPIAQILQPSSTPSLRRWPVPRIFPVYGRGTGDR